MTVESQLPGNAFGNVNPFSFVDPAGVEEVDGLVARVVLRSSILHAFFLLGDGNRLRLAKYSEIEDELRKS